MPIVILALFYIIHFHFYVAATYPDPSVHFDADPDPSFHFDADPDSTYRITLMPTQIRLITLMLIRIRIFIKVLRICDHWFTGPLRRQF